MYNQYKPQHRKYIIIFITINLRLFFLKGMKVPERILILEEENIKKSLDFNLACHNIKNVILSKTN